MSNFFESLPFFFTDLGFSNDVASSVKEFLTLHVPEAAIIFNNIYIGDGMHYRLFYNMSKCYIDATYLVSWYDVPNIWLDRHYYDECRNEYDEIDPVIFELFGIEIAKEHSMYYDTTWQALRVTQPHIADLRRGSMTPFDYSFFRFPHEAEIISYFTALDSTAFSFTWKRTPRVFSDLHYIPEYLLMNSDYAVRTVLDGSGSWFYHFPEHRNTLKGGLYLFYYEPFGSFDALFQLAFTYWYQLDLPLTKQLWDIGCGSSTFYAKLNYDLPDTVYFGKSFFTFEKLERVELLSETYQYMREYNLPEWDTTILFDIYA